MTSYGTTQFNDPCSQSQSFNKPANVLETRLVRSRLATSLLIVLSILQIACGVSVIVLQVLLNEQVLSEFEVPSQYYGYLCGTVVILNGIFCTFTAAFKTFYLMVTTSVLAVAGYLASALCCGLSIYIMNSFDDSFLAKVASLLNSTIDRAKTELLAMAALGAFNFVLSIIVSVVLCWAYGCACYRSRASSSNRPLLEGPVQVL